MANPVQNTPLDVPLEFDEVFRKIELRSLRQALLTAHTVNREYEALVASLFTALKRVQTDVCPSCRAIVKKLTPSYFPAVADIVASAPPLRFVDGSSHHVHFSRRIFKARRGGSLLAPTSDPADSPAVHHKLSKSSQGKITSTSLPSSPSVPQAVSSIRRGAEKRTQRDLSVKINKAKPSLKLSFELATAFEGSVVCVRFSSTGEYLAVGVNNKGDGWKSKVFDVKTGRSTFVMGELSAKKCDVHLCFSPNDQYLAVGSDMRVWIWDIKKNHIRTIFTGHTKRVTSVAFSPNGRFLASSSEDRTLRMWSVRDGSSKVLEDSAQSCFQVRFSPNGRYITTANDDGKLRIWNARTGLLVTRWRAHSDIVGGVVFTPDGRGLVSGGSREGNVKYWDISPLEQAKLGGFEMQKNKIKEMLKYTARVDIGTCLGISPNGQWVVCGSSDGIRILDVGSFAVRCTLPGHGQILSVDFSPTRSKYLASGNADGQLAYWTISNR